MTLLLVLAGGAVGAVCRFLTDRAITGRTGPGFPLGTLTVNLVGTLLLGLLVGAGGTLPGWVGTLVGTGFCGALTTYSTFGYETVRLFESPGAGRARALLNVALTVSAGLAAAQLGFALAHRL